MQPVKRANIPVVVVTAALFVAIASFVASSTARMMEREARSTVENVVKSTVGHIDGLMVSVESAVKNSGWIVAEHLDDPEYMFKITGELVQNNPFVVGSTIAFEPNFFPAKGRYYSAFSCRDGNGGIRRIRQGVEDFKYHGMDWYRIPKETKTASWCEPYFDKGGAEVMMCTYSQPLVDKDGKVYAVLTADVSLEDLTREVAAIEPYPNSYAVLISQRGSPIVAAPVRGTAALTPGTRLLVYTDGVTEAERKDHAQYGDDRLLAFASAHAKEGPADLVDRLIEDIDGFAAGAEQSDDIAALAVLVGGETKNKTA